MTNTEKLEISVGIGAPLCMAPELFDPDCVPYDRYADVYAFGMIAYELKVVNGLRPDFAEVVSTKMKELIERCWGNMRVLSTSALSLLNASLSIMIFRLAINLVN